MERFAFGVRLQIVWIGGDEEVRQGPAEGGEERRGELLVGVFGCGCRMSCCAGGGGERSVVVAALRSLLRRGVVLEEAASE